MSLQNKLSLTTEKYFEHITHTYEFYNVISIFSDMSHQFIYTGRLSNKASKLKIAESHNIWEMGKVCMLRIIRHLYILVDFM